MPWPTRTDAEIVEMIKAACTECPDCGEKWHYPKMPSEKLASRIFFAVNGKRHYVRVTVWDLIVQKPRYRKNWAIITSCYNPRCLNPELLKQVRKGEVIRRNISEGTLLNAAHRIKVIESRRRHSSTKLNPELAELIRHDERHNELIAAEHGITKEAVRKIKAGKLWKPTSAANNPFAGLMAA